MNYFGHAALAILRKEAPPFVLGAMLPDLAQMVGVHLDEKADLLDQEVQAGLKFHIQTDAQFHETRTFRSLNLQSLGAFARMKIRKGPARACAHIGVEMLIDAELAQSPQFQKPYRDALRYGVRRHDQLGCPPPEEQRLTGLLQHLDDKGVELHAATEERFIFRIERTLDSRERLRPTSQELSQMVHHLCHIGDIPRRTIALLDELAPLIGSPPGSPPWDGE